MSLVSELCSLVRRFRLSTFVFACVRSEALRRLRGFHGPKCVWATMGRCSQVEMTSMLEVTVAAAKNLNELKLEHARFPESKRARIAGLALDSFPSSDISKAFLLIYRTTYTGLPGAESYC
uniref:Uncharacterized protein n=1 Tax=Steinernema glaseri TaxID=37863 RepID=A0A1I7YRX9_9BILA